MLELQTWNGAEYERMGQGEDALLLRQQYKRQQWLTQEAWRQAFPGRSRAFRIVDAQRDLPLKPRSVRKRRLTGSISIEDQAGAYACWLAERNDVTEELRLTMWQPAKNRKNINKFHRNLAAALREQGFTNWRWTFVDPDTYHNVEETHDAEAVPSDASPKA